MKRRDFLRLTAAGSALLGSSGVLQGCLDRGEQRPRGLPPAFPGDAPTALLDVAEAAAAWIRSHSAEVRSGRTWPVAPGESDAVSVNLYSGTPGIILFLLELHHATGKREYLREAAEGGFLLQGAYTEGGGWPNAAGVSADDPTLVDPGLYTGMAGASFTLLELYRSTGDGLTLSGATSLLDFILGQAREVEGGLAWYDEDPEEASYDIISGSAGIGLTLLHAHGLLEAPGLLNAAERAGAYLLSRGRPVGDGLRWPASENNSRLMPNFSHGTAGVAYFLARLAQATGQDAFLQGALRGARYLQSVSRCSEDGCLVFHHEPGGEDLYYLGWCHGPPGTSRLYYELGRITGDDEWAEWVDRGADAIRNAGIPEARTEGYWNNVSQCCGDAGVGDFFLHLAAASEAGSPMGEALARRTPAREHADLARRIGRHLTEEARRESVGATWPQAEHRSQPELIQAQTGWMQGAAGVGAFFLHLDGWENGRPARILFPDSPWSPGA